MAASRVQQDTFMDDSDDACPLCVEEFDLSDKNFRPCPCGYQVCQFCYNNIKTNMNGLCPACRRPYDEKSIEWKIVSPEEFKADIALQARKKAAARQKEVERRQIESTNRKNLAGLRVVQKNLVYVVGLNPKIREEDLLQTLRGDQYFGQYGKIVKIVVSKAKEANGGNHSIGVYVTFARKEDAASCIAAVDGSQNGDRTLRAQYGTTKYCSAYLRHEVCNNRGCMFLHETGEDNDSFSRQDLSSMNAVSTQRPAASAVASSSRAKPLQPTPVSQPPPPPHFALSNVSAASHSMARQGSKDETMSRSDSGDGSALPSSATWVKHPQIEQSRRSSQAASRSTPSPRISNAKLPSEVPANQTPQEAPAPSEGLGTDAQTQASPEPKCDLDTTTTSMLQDQRPSLLGLERAFKTVRCCSYKWTLDRTMFDAETLNIIDNYPPLIDVNGGAVRFIMKAQQEQERLKEEEEQRNIIQAMSSAADDDEDNLASGSLQLGGEPETQDNKNDLLGHLSNGRRSLPQQRAFGSSGIGQPFDGQGSGSNNFAELSLTGRSLTPQQQQQMSLLKSHNQQHDAVFEHLQRGISSSTSQHQPQLSNPFQAQNQQLSALSGHNRQASRYNFVNDQASSSAAVKPASSAQLMAQQSAMMPPQLSKPFASQPSQQPNLHTNFYSGVQGPPPGLKSSGTPPISGGGMFGQGHGFASAMGGSLGLGGKNSNDDLMRDFLRGRGNGLGSEAGKREFMFPSFLQKPMTSTTSPAPGLQSPLYGAQLGVYNGYQDQGHLKQKKKGKKHRHANTSSSGGGGIVDLADPSIIQARVHHGGAGQGPYGGTQGQGLPENAAIQRPNEAVSGISRTTAAIPAKEVAFTTHAAKSLPLPPGLSSVQDFPPLVAPHKASTNQGPFIKVANTAPFSVMPAVPILPSQSTSSVMSAEGSKSSAIKSSEESIKGSTDKKAAPAVLLVTSSIAAVSQDSSESQKSSQMDSKETEAVNTPSPLGAGSPELPNNAPAGNVNALVANTMDFQSNSTSSEVAEKRQRPGKLDIAAAKDASRNDLGLAALSIEQTKPVTPSKNLRHGTNSLSQPGTPATAVSQSSASPGPRQTAPRTLRVSQTPKLETATRLPTGVANTVAPSTVASRQVSRQPSLASIDQPGTPFNEVSDNASLTSTSLSRPGSPSLGKIGIAPVRLMTKSQQKKERQARAKRAEESRHSEDPSSATMPEEPVQAPIIGRKKKAKKSKLLDSTDCTSVASGPISPLRQEELPREVSGSVTQSTNDAKKAFPEATEKNLDKATLGPETETLLGAAADIAEKIRRAHLTAAMIFSDLQKKSQLSSNVIDIFRYVPGVNHRFDITETDLNELNMVPSITEEQHELLALGNAICVETVHNKYAIVLPDRQVLRGFTRAQAERYMRLRQQVYHSNGASSFRSGSYNIDRWLNSDIRGGFNASGNTVELNAMTSMGHGNGKEHLKFMTDYFAITSMPRELQLELAPENFWEGTIDPRGSAGEGLPARRATVGVEEAERLLAASRKETEALEKKLNGVLKKNRKLLNAR